MNYVFAILGIGAIILIHELGHFIMAKVNGVKVLTFSIGFGPKILTHKGKETEYTISLLPVGGYVEMYGMIEDEEETEDIERKYISKSPLQRLSITIAGSFMNIVLAIALFGSIYTTFGYSETSLNKIVDSSPAMEAGIQPGDKITSVNGHKVYTTQDITLEMSYVESPIIRDIKSEIDDQAKDKGEDEKENIRKSILEKYSNSEGNPMTIQYERNGQMMETTLKPKFSKEDGSFLLGIGFDHVENPSLMQIIKHSTNETTSLITQNYRSISRLVTGKGSFKTDVGGIVSMTQIVSDAAKAGIWNVINVVAIMSIGVGIFNLLPLPVLDGGNCILLLIELITRRKVPDKIVNALNTIGVIFLVGLMLIVTIKDILFPING
ncbi:M50 family metallopeptidase [Clostridium sp. SHJSY1]|uniref:M50 family metallopeptidase n=1 Tax=Clostridium sp. SHJSY1 TaxID=2942483 RepID=UPI0028763E57|nr:M50 family metallopeptidase [Clostridium sp. SHJSY1]MDS0524893.1 M50 family metallopeptidase [Clostridium sp. SHJSY1]